MRPVRTKTQLKFDALDHYLTILINRRDDIKRRSEEDFEKYIDLLNKEIDKIKTMLVRYGR